MATIVKSLPYHGVSASKFFHCEHNGVQFLTKLCFYKLSAPEMYVDESAPSKYISHTDAELKILEQLKNEIILPGVSPCVLEIVYSVVCDNLDKIVASDQQCNKLTSGDIQIKTIRDEFLFSLCEYKDMVKNGLAKNKVAFIVLERCDITFDAYIRRGINTNINFVIFTSLLFMIIYTVHAISVKFPNFRHYDLHTENVMIKFDKNFIYDFNNTVYLEFRVDDKHVFYLPYFGLLPKIIDFGYSSNPAELTESIIVADKWQMYKRTEHDLLYFFHWTYASSIRTDWDPDNNVEKLLTQLDPSQSYMFHYPEAIRKNPRINSPLQMLMAEPFKQFATNVSSSKSIHKKFSIQPRG